MNEPTIRSFIAIELPDVVVRGLVGTVSYLRERLPGSDLKWVAPGNIHVTLKFLGEVRLSRIDDVRRVLESVCAATAPIRLSVDELGAFPSPRAPRIVWAGLEGDTERLVSLASRVDAALEPLGFPRESRPFTPHLTIARVRDDASGGTRNTLGTTLATTPIVGCLAFEAVAASLMKSQLTPNGAIYSRVAQFPLGLCPTRH